MRSLYLYAIVDRAGVGLPAMAGVGDGALSGVPVGDLLAVVSPVPLGQAPVTRANLLRHEAVVEALMEGRGVLPARFGTTVVELDLTAMLTLQAAELAGGLERVRGRVELALRVLDPTFHAGLVARPSRETAGDGRGYMRGLLAAEREQRRRREVTDESTACILAALAPLAEAAVYAGATGRQVLKAAYLVRREGLASLRHAIDAQRAAHPGLAFLATGPWPAYSFTGVNQSLGAVQAEGERR